MGDVVLIRYEGKSRLGTYRLGVIREVEVAPDKLVHTVLVEYSLLSEVQASERHLYTGLTKKTIRIPVQRLVLILPIEEQSLPLGGPAVRCPAPPDEAVSRNDVLEKNVGSRVVKKPQVSSLSSMWNGSRREVAKRIKSCRILEAISSVEVQDVEKEIFKQFFIDKSCDSCFVEIH